MLTLHRRTDSPLEIASHVDPRLAKALKPERLLHEGDALLVLAAIGQDEATIRHDLDITRAAESGCFDQLSRQGKLSQYYVGHGKPMLHEGIVLVGCDRPLCEIPCL